MHGATCLANPGNGARVREASRGRPDVDTPVHLERLPAAEEASNEDRLLTVVSLGLVAMLGVLVARLPGP
jgi:hypothetical protein